MPWMFWSEFFLGRASESAFKLIMHILHVLPWAQGRLGCSAQGDTMICSDILYHIFFPPDAWIILSGICP